MKAVHVVIEHLIMIDLVWVGHKTIVGTPEQVADEMIEWFEKRAMVLC